MSRYILKAECATASPFVDFLQSSSPSLDASDPTNLIVFVGDKAKQNSGLSILPCSGGQYARQKFQWTNLDRISNLDQTKLFLDYNNITVTLSVELEAKQDPLLTYGTAGSTIPAGALAINLGSKGFQFNSSNMINGDTWGKLVYYEPGSLGVGWAFSANDYMPQTYLSQANNNLGMYLLGGLLPDVSYTSLSSQTNATFASSYPSSNLQVGRDQALLTQMVSTSRVDGPQGYWSVQPTNYDTAAATDGRAGGMLYSGGTVTPVFNSYSPFGFMALSYPTALSTTVQTSANKTVGWNLQFPSYGPSTQDGYMPTGNAISVSPGSFFTAEGLALLQNQASNPSAPTVPAKLWTDYWSINATNVITLQETKPFYIEAPMFNAPIAMNLIPNVNSGLNMLVPITRLYNGVYLYTPIKTASSGNTQPMHLNTQAVTDASYFVNPFGTLQKWFAPKRVALTLNFPFVRVDTALQASRFFNTPYMNNNFTTTVPLWLKYYFVPPQTENGIVNTAFNVDTTASIQQIRAAMPGGDTMQFVYTAKQLLERFSTVLATYGIPVSSGWGLQTLEISRIMVSCTLMLDFPRLYRSSYALTQFTSSCQGAILQRGGTKVFSRCGSSLSAGPPSQMTLLFSDVLGDNIGHVTSTGGREAVCDVSDVVHQDYGTAHNDYFNSTSSFIFSRSVFLRIPEYGSVSDSGGSVIIDFQPHPIINMPFSGEVLKNVASGGPQFKSSDISSGTLTTTNLASYANGWFNNLNPFSPDYKESYSLAVNTDDSDPNPFLDYKLVDFLRRKIEIWFQIQVPVQIYTGSPFT